MKSLLFVSALLVSSLSLAKSLNCNDGPSFTNKSFSINRDGAIGFDGTAINMSGESALGSNYESLADITGRAADADLSLTGLILYISPKLACTKPQGGPTESFNCPLVNATIIATGTGTRDADPGIFDRITLNSQLQAQVTAKLVYKGDVAELSGSVKANGKLVNFSIPVSDTAGHCHISDL